jgi:hypothetical protein
MIAVGGIAGVIGLTGGKLGQLGYRVSLTEPQRTSFLKICRSVPPSTSHLLLHKKLLKPSSLTLACPVLITVFLPSLN